MDPATTATIEVTDPPVEAEYNLTAEKVQTLKVVELKVELQRRALSNIGRKDVF